MEGLEDLRLTLEEALLAVCCNPCQRPSHCSMCPHTITQQATARRASYDHPTVVANFRFWLIDGQDSRSNLPSLRLCKDVDKQWIHNPNKCADDYLDEINQFIDFAIANNRGST